MFVIRTEPLISMVLSQRSLYQASSRKRMYKAPTPQTAHQHFSSELSGIHEWDMDLPLLQGTEQIRILERTVMVTFLLKPWQLNFSPWLHSVIQDSQKISICPQPSLCSSSPEHPSRLGAGLGHTSPPLCIFWPCRGPMFSEDKVQGWRENKYCNLERNKLQVCQGANHFWQTISNLQSWLCCPSVVRGKVALVLSC